MIDPLATFRKTAASPSSVTPSGADGNKEQYVAFGAKDRVTRLRVRSAMAPTRSLGYIYLRDVAYDGQYGTNFALDFTFLLVLVRGKNLQTVIAAIESGMTDFIQEFDPSRWERPKDPAAAIIDTIQIITPESGSIEAALEQSKDSAT